MICKPSEASRRRGYILITDGRRLREDFIEDLLIEHLTGGVFELPHYLKDIIREGLQNDKGDVNSI